jgi:hypothetical protein
MDADCEMEPDVTRFASPGPVARAGRPVQARYLMRLPKKAWARGIGF